jgi:hypothetical protein
MLATPASWPSPTVPGARAEGHRGALSSPLDVDLPRRPTGDKAMAMPARSARIQRRDRDRSSAPAISTTVARVARESGAGLILLGACRVGVHRRPGRVFSETVENLLRRADCRVNRHGFPAGTASLPADVPRGHDALSVSSPPRRCGASWPSPRISRRRDQPWPGPGGRDADPRRGSFAVAANARRGPERARGPQPHGARVVPAAGRRMPRSGAVDVAAREEAT